MAYESIDFRQDITIDRLYTIHYFEYTNDFIFSGESHPFWEFLYVDKGEVIINAGDRQLSLKKDEIIFHKPDEFHAVRSNGKVAPNLIVISFACNSPCMDFFAEKTFSLSKTERQLLAQIILEAKQLFSTPLNDPWTQKMQRVAAPPFGCEQLIRLYLEQFLLHLIRRSQPVPRHTNIAFSEKNGAEDALYQQIIAYLEKHLDSQLTLAEICHDNLISYARLVRLFGERHNCSVMKFFSEMKLDAAKQLIRAQDLNFTQIADALGYSSVHYFSRHFKKLTGMSPSEYAASAKMIAEAPAENEDILQAFSPLKCYNEAHQGGNTHEERNQDGCL